MPDPRFHHNVGPFTVAELAAAINTELTIQGDADYLVRDVAALAQAGAEDLSYCSERKYLAALQTTQAGALCVTPELAAQLPAGCVGLVHPQPALLFAQLCHVFYPPAKQHEWLVNWVGLGLKPYLAIHQSVALGPNVIIGHHVVIGENVTIGGGTHIGPNTVINPGVMIGRDCRIGPNVTLSHCIIGDEVQIDTGTRIGQEGFGFIFDHQIKRHLRVPQLGRVRIEEYAQLGANVTIDRGTLGDTFIGPNAIIDNLVQLGHNVQIGTSAIVVAQAGIAGSSTLGNFAVVAAQGGVADHIQIGDGAQIAAQSGIMRDVPAGAKMMGSPAMPIKDYFRQITMLGKLLKRPTDSR